MQTAREIQLGFLHRVKATLPANRSFVNELAELLNTSNDSAYRRMRGDTLLGLDEIALICDHFNVAFLSAPSASGSATFTYHRLKDDPDSFTGWFGNLLQQVKHIAASPGNEITYAADDVPIWHHFNTDHLACFKLFYWQKSILSSPHLADQRFDPALIGSNLLQTAKNLLEQYHRTCSTEIWTEDSLNSTLKQVEYYWESGLFRHKAEALQLCDEIASEIDLLKQQAATGRKIPGGNHNFTLYQSEVMLGNNSIVVRAGNQKTAYISNHTFNVMSTQDTRFIEETETWLGNITRRSVFISGVNEKQRNRFFRTLQDRIDNLRRLIG